MLATLLTFFHSLLPLSAIYLSPLPLSPLPSVSGIVAVPVSSRREYLLAMKGIVAFLREVFYKR